MELPSTSHQRPCGTYVIITPVRDEASHIEETIKSVTLQTIRPAEWVVVDDGSTDGTGKILDRYAALHPWITVVHRPDRGFRKSGNGVMEAFYQGLDAVKSPEWDFLVKLDGDLSFEASYFEKCFDEFAADPSLGVGGGVIYLLENGAKKMDNSQRYHVRGATKIYRRPCWDAIGGLIRTTGWDTVDEVKANMAGWKTRSFLDIQLRQHRPTGATEGRWENAVKNGQADYVSGYHPVFMLAKCLKRLFQRPLLLGAMGHLYGFMGGYLRRLPRGGDRDLVRYVRRQQMRRLFFKESIWK